jgi:DNA-binding GntR family transcriptional regulator
VPVVPVRVEEPDRDITQAHYERLRADILSGRYPPGSVLLETVLSKEYGVSRTPVREALGRLNSNGWLERMPRGFRVRVRSTDEILEIYGVRILIEAASAEQAAENRNAVDLVQLEYLSVGLDGSGAAAQQRLQNKRWHEALRGAAHNDTLTRLLVELDSLLIIYAQKKRRESAPDPGIADHLAVFEAVRDRDGAAAKAAMAIHLARARDERIAALLSGPA